MYGTSDVALAKAACGGVGWVGGGCLCSLVEGVAAFRIRKSMYLLNL